MSDTEQKLQDPQNKPTRTDQMQRYTLVRRILRRVPYSLGTRVLNLTLIKMLLRWVFKANSRPLQHLNQHLNQHLKQKPIKPWQRDTFIQVNFLSNWRLSTLPLASEPTFNRYVSFSGLEHLERYRGTRGIILCNSHFGAGKLAAPLLARKGYEVLTLDRVNSYNYAGKANLTQRLTCVVMGTRHQSNFLVKALFKCQRTLSKKGIVHLVADGYRGNSAVVTDFLGMQREFRTSFADLALAADAVAVPIVGRIKANGEITIDLLPPIDPRDIEGSNGDKVETMCKHYSKLLDTLWRDEPEQVFKHDIRVLFDHSQSISNTINTPAEA